MRGAEQIKAALKDIPNTSGVYRMLNAAGDILYIGKAKNLANRVSNYTSASALSTRILRMVSQVERVEITTTQNEAEALLLEASLVKKHQPRYNVLLKDDKSFPFIIFSDHAFPRLSKHRGRGAPKGSKYFGPFASAGAVSETLSILQKAFLLRPCSDSIFNNRSRPCLQYQIKRCSAPCVGYVDEACYAQQVALATDFLRGKNRDVQDVLVKEMVLASESMDYEKAALLRDRIAALTKVQQEQALHAVDLENADVIALHRDGSAVVVMVYFFRAGQHFGQHAYFPKQEEASDGEILLAFLGQFYQRHLPPAELLLSHEIEDVSVMEDALSQLAQTRVVIRVPQRGDKRTLIEQALSNAALSLARTLNERASIAKHHVALQQLFNLAQPPQRIEIYDNSHVMGTQAVGVMVVATPEGFEKKSYRSFTIKDPATIAGDDYGMMREVMKRRFKEGATLPDLVLIDGGKGQLSAVLEITTSLGIEGPAFVAIAKGEDRNAGREWFFRKGHEPFQLPENDVTLHYLQRLRDEAHRFAIGAHRKKRSKALTQSALDDIPNIGASRKRALLLHFGSRADVERATLNELENVPGISKKIAATIYEYFHA
ncbi:MAG: excinuclease ABC subunit UvrC [Rickettsiales bacterium]